MSSNPIEEPTVKDQIEWIRITPNASKELRDYFIKQKEEEGFTFMGVGFKKEELVYYMIFKKDELKKIDY